MKTIKLKYHYYVSHRWWNDVAGTQGDGCCEYTSDSPLNEYQRVVDAATLIMNNNKFTNCIIQNFILLKAVSDET
jgi:hypothetical protein